MSLRSDFLIDMKVHGYDGTSLPAIIKAWISHPSVRLLVNYRLAQRTKISFIKRLLWLNSVKKTGCHLSFNSIIEPGVIFPHASGIVIGNGAHIGAGTKIYHHVTLAVRDDEENKSATIKNNVMVYTGAVLIGNIMIGENAIIGANAVVKNDIPAHALAVGIPATIKTANASI